MPGADIGSAAVALLLSLNVRAFRPLFIAAVRGEEEEKRARAAAAATGRIGGIQPV